jgi:hypothetical protein
MVEPRQLAIVDDYEGLVAALRRRIADLGTTMAVIDQVAGIPDGYTQKLIGRAPVKRLGVISLGPVLGALGLKLAVVVDVEHEARIRSRLTPDRWSPRQRQRYAERPGAPAGIP